MPIPAYQSILAELIHVRESVSAEPNIRVSIRFFKFLLQLAIENRPFDEEAYLTANPDVREAIARGAFASGREHFVLHGYFEGRVLGTLPVDEVWYRAVYPDVVPAIDSGAFSSATDHYVRAGVFEWRLPSAAAFDEFERWKTALLGTAPGSPPVAHSGVAAPETTGTTAEPEPATAHTSDRQAASDARPQAEAGPTAAFGENETAPAAAAE